MSEPILPKAKRGCLFWVAWSLGILVAAYLLLLVLVSSVWIFQVPFHLLAGGVLHAKRAFAHFGTDLPKLMTTAVLPCLATAIALWGAHRLILWWRLENGNREGWHLKHTALSGSLVLLGSAAAIALSGVVHELVWLPQGKILRSNKRPERVMAINNARQLGIMLFEYDTEHGTFPESLGDLEELAADSYRLQRMVFVDLGPTHPPEPFVLVNPGSAMGSDPNEAILISPQMPERGDFVTLRMDMSVTSLSSTQFIELVTSASRASKDGK